MLARFVDVDLHPDRVSNTDMGYVFEELIRRFAELSNETAGEHFTPREVIALMVELLFANDWDRLRQPGAIVTMYDPAAGTGGMLSVAEEHLRDRNGQARLVPHAQELNDESYAICKADMLIKGQEADNVAFGNSFTEDAFPTHTFDYVIANPPYGVDWKGYAKPIEREHAELGHDGRFGPGLPAKSDGQLLFLLHMLSKLKPYDHATGDGGGRMAIIMNGSPLFSGAPGGGESEIRRHVIEHDLLEAIVAMPDQLFYNTGISTYVWILTNRKRPERAGTVQLIDGRELFQKMRKSLGNKRNELGDDHIEELVRSTATLPTTTTAPRSCATTSSGSAGSPSNGPAAPATTAAPRAVERLREHPDWSADNVRKADADRADEVLAAVEQAVAELPADGHHPQRRARPDQEGPGPQGAAQEGQGRRRGRPVRRRPGRRHRPRQEGQPDRRQRPARPGDRSRCPTTTTRPTTAPTGCARASTSTSRPRSCPTPPTPGPTTTRPSSATRSPSPASSTATSPHAPSRRSTPTSARSNRRSSTSSAR